MKENCLRDGDHTPLLVIGAGPYGLAIAAHALNVGIESTIVGAPMAFWRQNMPRNMMLRSGADWHMDVAGVHTFASFLTERGISPAEVNPIPISLFLEYAEWFQDGKGIEVEPDFVRDLTKNGHFEATLESGRRVTADAVVAAPGISRFKVIPPWTASLNPSLFSHTCDLVDFEPLVGRRVLIVGGRQSAFEWAALLADEGAAEVHVVHRHAPPEFTASDWSFVDGLMDLTVSVPGWFRNLSLQERDAVAKRFWGEGRLKLEPWLTPRLTSPPVHRHDPAAVECCEANAEGEIEVDLSSGERLVADHIVLATGYKSDMMKVPYLSGVMDHVELSDGFPVLDEQFQTTLGGLFVTGFPATKDFGPFFGFVRGCVPAATLTVAGLSVALA